MNSFFEIMKRFALVVLYCFFLLILFCGNVWLAYTNFAALKVSFEYMGYDMSPLGDETLTGFVWGSFGLDNLTIADMYAAAMAFFVALLSAVVSHHLYRTIMLVLDRRVYAKSGQTNLVEQADIAIIRDLVYMCGALALLIPIALWDIQLFRFRTAIALLGLEKTPMALKDWPFILEQYGNLYTIQLIRFGAWAYIFLIVGAGLLFDLCWDRVRESLARLGAAFQAWYKELTGAERPEAPQPQQIVQMESSGTAQVIQAAVPQRTTPENFGNGIESVEFPKSETVKPNYTNTSTDEKTSAEEVTVYGGKSGEKVKFSVAAADPENYYIDELRRVWNRSVRPAVNADSPAAAA